MTESATLLTKDDVDRWVADPLVARAFRLAGETASAVDVLETLSEMLSDLESRFPNMRFREIFCQEPNGDCDRAQMARRMVQAGVDAADVRALFGDSDAARAGDALWSHTEFALASSDLSKSDIMALHGYSDWDAACIIRLRHPLKSGYVPIANSFENGERNLSKLARDNGVSLNTLKGIVRRRRYERWLEAQTP